MPRSVAEESSLVTLCHWVSGSSSRPFSFPHKVPNSFIFSTIRATCPVHLIAFDLINNNKKKYLVRSAIHEARHEKVTSKLLLLPSP